MMLSLRSLLFGAAPERDDGGDELHLAAAALLVEAATLDGHFDSSERDAIAAALAEGFDLAESETAALIATAERRVDESSQILGFTRVIKDRLTVEDRVRVIEMLWRVAYADGELHDYEAGLVRRVAGLLYVPDRESGAARHRVLARLDTGGRGPT